jgi:uncharacterized protein YkwD
VLIILLALFGIAALTGCDAKAAQDEFTAVNQLRAAHGLAPLVRSAELDRKAEGQAVRMARREQIFHSSSLESGVSPGWRALGENVGVGGDVASVHAALEASPAHMANMLDTLYNEVGVGVVTRDGRTYVVQDFDGR